MAEALDSRVPRVTDAPAAVRVGGLTRRALRRLHRYLGLTMAGFLIVSGVTGSVISWDHELDAWLNPHLLSADSQGIALPSTELLGAIEARYPQAQVTYFENAAQAGHSQYFWVEPRVNPATSELYELDFNQAYMDPVTGQILGTRYWGAFWPLSTETFVSFLYELHYSLHIPEFLGIDHWGIWLLGAIALVWTIDCFIGFALTLPRRRTASTSTSVAKQYSASADFRGYWQRWKPAWRIRWRGGATRMNFDIHRAFGLWTWMVLFTIAFTAFSLNLYREIFYPAMTLVSDVTPTPIDARMPTPHNAPIEPQVTFAQVMRAARNEADQRGWDEPVGSMWYAREFGVYRAEFYRPGEGHGAGGVGHRALFFDSADGRLLGDWLPWQGTAADIFVQAQFPLHSGRILGLTGRILISIMGLVVAALSITGVIIWWRRHRARRWQRDQSLPSPSSVRFSPASPPAPAEVAAKSSKARSVTRMM